MKKYFLSINKATRLISYYSFICLLSFSLQACQESPQIGAPIPANAKLFTITPRTLTNTLYFNGLIRPAELTSITSPAEGIVVNQYFHYGDTLKKEQLLLQLNSKEAVQHYHTALANYLQAKDKFTRSQTKAAIDKKLFELGIIAKNEYEDSVSTLNIDNITYLQTLHTLKNLAIFPEISSKNLTHLKINELEKIDRALSISNTLLSVYAPSSGLALLPEDKDGNPNDPIKIGASVKFGEVLLNLSNLNAITVNIQVTEINVSKLKIGQAVTITGDAFPNERLKGNITRIGAQAFTSSNNPNSLPVFNVNITVEKLNERQRKFIRVGMSAKITISLKKEKVILIPIEAVYQKNNENSVKKVLNHGLVETPVTVGDTSLNEIEIIEGLNMGDTISYLPENTTQPKQNL